MLETALNVGQYVVSLLLLGLAAFWVFTKLTTSYNDMQKVHDGDIAIALDIGAKLIAVGFIMAVAAYQTKTLLQALIWGILGAMLLGLSYWALKTFVWKDIEAQLGNNNIAVGIFSASISIFLMLIISCSIS